MSRNLFVWVDPQPIGVPPANGSNATTAAVVGLPCGRPCLDSEISIYSCIFLICLVLTLGPLLSPRGRHEFGQRVRQSHPRFWCSPEARQARLALAQLALQPPLSTFVMAVVVRTISSTCHSTETSQWTAFFIVALLFGLACEFWVVKNYREPLNTIRRLRLNSARTVAVLFCVLMLDHGLWAMLLLGALCASYLLRDHSAAWELMLVANGSSSFPGPCLLYQCSPNASFASFAHPLSVAPPTPPINSTAPVGSPWDQLPCTIGRGAPLAGWQDGFARAVSAWDWPLLAYLFFVLVALCVLLRVEHVRRRNAPPLPPGGDSWAAFVAERTMAGATAANVKLPPTDPPPEADAATAAAALTAWQVAQQDKCGVRRAQARRTPSIAPSAAAERVAPVVDLTSASGCAECTICFEQLHTQRCTLFKKGAKRSCNHFLHEACARQLVSLSRTRCPVCRAEFDEVARLPSLLSDPEDWFLAADVQGNERLSMARVSELLLTQFPLDSARLDEAMPSLWAKWDVGSKGYVSRADFVSPGGVLDWLRANLLLCAPVPARAESPRSPSAAAQEPVVVNATEVSLGPLVDVPATPSAIRVDASLAPTGEAEMASCETTAASSQLSS